MASESQDMLRACWVVYLFSVASALNAHSPQAPKPHAESVTNPGIILSGVDTGANDNRIDMLKPIQTMQHNGSYGNNAASQLAYLKYMLPDILESLSNQKDSVVYDLGCADALNTMVMLREIQKIKPGFIAGLIDQEGNDWETARKELAGWVGELVPVKGYYQPIQSMPLRSIMGTGLGITAKPFDAKVTEDDEWLAPKGTAAVLMAASFYQQVAQSDSVNVAVSNTAVHFLSGGAFGTPKLQAEADWLDFLRGREAELVEGGTLHVSGLARASDDRYPPKSFMHIYELVTPVLEEAHEYGFIKEKQKKDFKLPIYHRTDLEWQQPFLNGEVAGLKLDKFEMVAIRSPYWTEAKYNMVKFKELYVPSILAWIEPYIDSQLGPKVVDLFKTRLSQKIDASPWNFQDDYLQAVMVIRKKLLELDS